MSDLEHELRARASAHGQEHLFAFWGELDESARKALLDQVASVDFELVAKHGTLLGESAEAVAGEFQPPDLFGLDRAQAPDSEALRREGADLIAAGEVGLLLVAGGQASRLGYDGPKGDFPVGPVTGRTLFHFHAQRLRAAERRHGVELPWYVMTSPANDQDTRRIFERNEHFGLKASQVRFFSQSMIPALDLQGRILLASKGSLFLAPNGHGGTLEALARSGCLEDARQRGVQVLSYFQVDNPLVRPADPLFLAIHSQAGARMSSKVVAKRDAGEKVGVIGKVDGKLGCIEYSDLPANLREARDDSGQLLFRAGNIAAHLLQLDFVEELTRTGLELPWHVARKRMSCVDEQGRITEVDGAKFETFIFDALGKSPQSVTLEVDRALEFSPVKNAEGEDSPATARRDLCRLFSGWAKAAGHALPQADDQGLHAVEVDPLLAEDQASFEASGPHQPRQLDDAGLWFEAP